MLHPGMKRMSLAYFLPMLPLLVYCTQVETPTGSAGLIVILMDGFRWDAITEDLQGFQMMIKQGVKAEYLKPDFPSLSYVNYYSIMTGLHADRHGFVHNYMYDAKHNEEFRLGEPPNVSHPFWWEDGEPLWVTAFQQGLRAHMFDWSGCEVVFNGHRPRTCRVYHAIPSLEDTFDAVNMTVKLFSQEMADFVGIYSEFPDHTSHLYGPDSQQVKDVVKQLDNILLSLLKQLQTTTGPDGSTMLSDTVNVVVVSDHGMTTISPDRTVNLTYYLDMSDVERTMHGDTVFSIWPQEGKLDKVYSDLLNKDEHMKVYRKQDLPPEWHLAGHYRTPPILVVAELGYVLLKPSDPNFPTLNETNGAPMVGHHGYNNSEKDMHGIFLAVGPNFKQGYKQPGFPNVDIYQILCAILAIHPSSNDGNWDEVSGMLQNVPHLLTPVSFKSVIITGIVAFFSMGGVCLLSFVFYNCRTSRVKHYRPLHMDHDDELDM